MPSTIKFHIIEKHLIPLFLRRFRGLKEYDESFIERAHQLGKKLEQKSSNVKSYGTKASLHNQWFRARENPKVHSAIARHDQNRKRLPPSHPKMIEVKRKRVEAKEKLTEERELVKMEAAAEIGDGLFIHVLVARVE